VLRGDGRLVILGATGFIGGSLAREARERGIEVLALSSSNLDLSLESSSKLLSDLLRSDDIVVHAAAVVPARTNEDLTKNIQITRHVANTLSALTVEQFILVSSDAVYGSASGLVSEATKTSPDTLHGAMSLAREIMCQIIKAKVNTIVRLAPVYGEEDTHGSYGPNRFVRHLKSKGKIEIFGDGDSVRDHVSVDDVVEVILALIQSRSAGVFNVASGKSVSFLELAVLLSNLHPLNPAIESTGSESDPTFRYFDLTELRKVFPEYSPIPIEQGIHQLIKAINP